MRYLVSFLLVVTLCRPSANGQEPVGVVQTERECSYDGSALPDSVYTFGTVQEAEQAVDRILRPVGLVRRFTIQASTVNNAAAIIRGETRYLLYNQQFMERVKAVNPDWAALSIMAHEVGHHLNGHTLMPGGSRPPIELEADQFSGFVLAALGANLHQAQAAINALVGDVDTPTHPRKSVRLLAIQAGWTRFQEQYRPQPTAPAPTKEAPAAPPLSTENVRVKLAASAELTGKKFADGNLEYVFSLWLDMPQEILNIITDVEYDLQYARNPLRFRSSDRKDKFLKQYTGWGCYRTLVVTARLTTGSTVRHLFDMCSILPGWD